MNKPRITQQKGRNMMNEKHVRISIQEEVIDHGKKRKERKRLNFKSIYIGLLILSMSMVMSHDIKIISNEEAETNETEINGSDLVKANITLNQSILVGVSDDIIKDMDETTTNEENEGEIITQTVVEETTTQEVTTEEELITESVETEIITEPETEIPTEEETTTEEVTEVSIDNELRYNPSPDEWDVFTRIVEAEVTGNNPDGVDYDTAVQCKLHVAQVILNRVESSDFPDNIIDVVHSPKQFSPISDGRFYSVVPSEATIEACNMALSKYTEDTVYGALYFRIGGDWSYLNRIFTDEVGHQFYTE